MRQTLIAALLVVLASLSEGHRPVAAEAPFAPVTITDYDEGDFYLVRNGKRQPYHGMRDCWIFNRAMVWLDEQTDLDDVILCYSSHTPLLLTGNKQVSRWFAGKNSELDQVDDCFTRFVKKDPELKWDHAALPPFQFQIEQHSRAQLEVKEASHPWQLIVVVKGRSGPPLYSSPWQTGQGMLSVDLLKLYRRKGYDHHFAELNIFVATWTENPSEQANVVFRLQLEGDAVIVPSLPVIRTVPRSFDPGVPIHAVVLDQGAQRLGRGAVEVTGLIGKKTVRLLDAGDGIWKAVVRGVPLGDYKARLRAVWKDDPTKTVSTNLDIRVTDGHFMGYNPDLKLLTIKDKPLGPITGSYRGQVVFKGIGTARESPLHGQQQWAAASADKQKPEYGFHWWESLTEAELDADYAYLQRCGWRMVHLCSGWLWWPRFDAAGRLSPFYAEQLAKVCAAAARHQMHLHLAVSHYPLGKKSPPYARYLEAGYKPKDYDDPDSKFFQMFGDYLGQLATVLRDETALSSFTAAGEGDPFCGRLFVNRVNDRLAAEAPNHLFLCEPHHQITQDPNFYRKTGWKPRLGGMRTYHIEWLKPQPPESYGVQFKLAAMGHIFMGESCFYGFLGGNHQYMNMEMPIDSYREQTRAAIYGGLVHRNPILLTWEERIVEDERVVFEWVRQAVDWSVPFEIPPLAIRVGPKIIPVKSRARLFQYENRLSRIPMECTYVWQDDPVPTGTLFTIDARGPLVQPKFVSDGGTLPEALKARMPLCLPDGFTANYSWSQDHQTLLAFIRKPRPYREDDSLPDSDPTTVDAHSKTAAKPDRPKQRTDIRLQNFPSRKLSYTMFDLAAKEVLSLGQFEKGLALEVPQQGRHFFLFVAR